MIADFYDYMAEAIHKQNHEYTNDKIPRDLWGYHLICSVKGCPDNIINSVEMVEKFVLDAVDAIKMQPIGKPICRFFDDKDGKGCSVIQLLSESHVSAHTDGSPGVDNAAFIDIFSCSYFDTEKIYPLIKETFNYKDWSNIFLVRNPGLVKVITGV